MSRRTFVRRLTATGLSLGAALSYADLLRADNARGATRRTPGRDYYDFYGGPTAAPHVTTEDPTDIQPNSVVAWGIVDPNGGPTEAWFELREAGASGWTSTSHAMLTGDGSQSFSTPIGGLDPDSAYALRAVASNALGKRTGATIAFKTANVALTPPPTTPPAGAGPVAGGVLAFGAPATPAAAAPVVHRHAPVVRLGAVSSLRHAQKKGTIMVPVTVDAAADVVVDAKKGVLHRHKKARAATDRMLKIARQGRGDAAAGKPVVVKLRLNRAGRRLVKDRRSVDVLIEVHAVTADGLRGRCLNVVRLTG